MTPLHSSFQTVIERRVVPAFIVALNAGVFLCPLIPRVAPVEVIIIAAAIQLVVCGVYYSVFQN